MTRSHLLAAVLVIGGACAHPASQPRVVGPVIGESTARGPSNPSVPPPDPGGVKEVSAPIHGTPSPVANPAIVVDTMPSTLEPSGNNSNQQTPVVSGVISGAAPVGTTTGATTGTAGANGPGTGNGRATPTGPATGGAATTGGTTPANPPSATAPAAPPSNGPGTGNTVNTAPVQPNAPVQAPVQPR